MSFEKDNQLEFSNEFNVETIREIVGSHVFYFLILIFITICIYKAIPAATWAHVYYQVLTLGIASIVITFNSLMVHLKSYYLSQQIIRLHKIITETEVENVEDS